MSDWIKGTIVWMWVAVSVQLMVLAVFSGVLKSPDVRQVIGEVVFEFFAPVWIVMTVAVVSVMVLERMAKKCAKGIERIG